MLRTFLFWESSVHSCSSTTQHPHCAAEFMLLLSNSLHMLRLNCLQGGAAPLLQSSAWRVLHQLTDPTEIHATNPCAAERTLQLQTEVKALTLTIRFWSYFISWKHDSMGQGFHILGTHVWLLDVLWNRTLKLMRREQTTQIHMHWACQWWAIWLAISDGMWNRSRKQVLHPPRRRPHNLM